MKEKKRVTKEVGLLKEGFLELRTMLSEEEVTTPASTEEIIDDCTNLLVRKPYKL